MKKIALLLICSFFIISQGSFALATTDEVKIIIDDSQVLYTENSGLPYVDYNSRTQVPLRQTLEQFGAEVTWNANDNTAIIVKNGIEVIVPIDQDFIWVDGVKVINDTKAIIKDNRTFLPIRIVIEAFGGVVKWNSVSESVSIVSKDNSGAENSYLEFAKELSSEKYEGKQPGTQGYEAAAGYIADKFFEFGLLSVTPEGYISNYETDLVQLVSESVRIGNNQLEVMVDYMPFSRTSPGTYHGEREFVFVKEGMKNDYEGISVIGKAVVFSYFDSNDDFNMGLLDRVNIAAELGASEVFIITNGELKVGHYEHPIASDEVGILVTYITEEIAKSLGIYTYDDVKYFDKQLEYSVEISRKTNVISQNVTGLIKGVDESKMILFVTNLDGFGTLPNDYVYENTLYSALSPAMFLTLADYYSKNQPEVNIMFAVVGDKWTNHKGITFLMDNLELWNIITVIDIYSVGRNNDSFVLGFDENSSDNSLKSNLIDFYYIAGMSDYGNSLSSTINEYVDNGIFIRGNDSWIDNAKLDTFSNLNMLDPEAEISLYKDLVDRIIIADATYTYSIESESVYNEIADYNYQKIESQYFDILYDDAFSETIEDISFLKELDEIYERLLDYNYYPLVTKRPIAVFSEETIPAAKLGDRLDVYEDGHNVGGGFSSFVDSPTNVVYCKGPSLYTFSHELNHLFVVKTIQRVLGDANYSKANEEAQGHTYAVYYSDLSFIYDEGEYLKTIFYYEEVMKIAEDTIAGNANGFNWGYLVEDSPYYHSVNYELYASMYDFILYNYGTYAHRRTIFRVYEAQDSNDEMTAMISETGLSGDEFISAWSSWMYSKGQTKITAEQLSKRTYTEEINEYDEKWYPKIWDTSTIEQEDQIEYTNEDNGDNIITSINSDLSMISKLSSVGDVNIVSNIDSFQNLKHIADNTYTTSLGIFEDKLVIQIDLTHTNDLQDIVVFLQGDTPGLLVRKSFSQPMDTLTVTIKTSLAKTFTEGLAINLGDDEFMFISKNDVDKMIKLSEVGNM